ncbi:MAG: fatty acid desaturase [Chromatiales bacterium]|jgi:stearoyl-CoA desaturase (delta-9 desaturase)
MLYGLIDLSWWQLVLLGLGLTHVTIASVTIFLHRAQAHRALELHPAVAHFFRFWLWLTTGMITRQWVAVHRKHHARCETPEDPHSPQVLGLSKVLWEGAELYRDAARDPGMVERFGHGTPDDWMERQVYTRHNFLGVTLLFFVQALLFGLPGIALWAVQMVWIPFWAAGVINGVGHYWGYRNFDAPDASTNIAPLGVLIGGEELHNNHHAFPSSAKLSARPWELDIGWAYIRGLSALGLARVKKVAPRPALAADKDAVDMDTVRAVIQNRMHVLASYAREVMLPVSRHELCADADASCRRLYRQTRKLLLSGERRMDALARDRLTRILDQHQRLRTVYQYRQRLQEVWERTASSQETLLQALQEWCRQAESTGIKALQDFAHTLRRYSLQPQT